MKRVAQVLISTKGERRHAAFLSQHGVDQNFLSPIFNDYRCVSYLLDIHCLLKFNIGLQHNSVLQRFIIIRERICLILYAKHEHFAAACVFESTFAIGRNSHDAPS